MLPTPKQVPDRSPWTSSKVWVSLISGLLLAGSALAQKPLTLTILHTNDLHAHVEPTAIKGATFGGYARHATLIKEIRKKEKNVILLNAGDVFQGTLYFNTFEGLADLNAMNALKYDAMCLGNHEFDKGPGVLSEFVKRTNFPVLCSNLDSTNEPLLSPYVKPSTVLTVDGQKIGVVGATTESTPNISSPGATLKFNDVVSSVQKEVDELTRQGINKIVVLTHIGFEEDKAMAAKLRNVDVIVGGHSHTPLGTPALAGWRPSESAYPTYVKSAEGIDIPIVQAWEWGKVMGKIKISFDAAGKITRVNEAAAIVVDDKIPEDRDMSLLVSAFKKPIDAIGLMKIGRVETAVTDKTLVGYFVADSYLEATKGVGATVAFMNPGGVRANIEAGDMNYGQAISVCPFKNTLVVCEMTGEQILALLKEGKGGLIPSAGTKYTNAGGEPRDLIIAGEPVDRTKTYKVTVNNFMAGGGDSLFTLKSAKQIDTGLIDIDAFVEFIKKASPLKITGDIRIGR